MPEGALLWIDLPCTPVCRGTPVNWAWFGKAHKVVGRERQAHTL